MSITGVFAQSVCLEFLSKKFNKDITDERGYRGDFKIGSGKNISDCPSYPPLLPHPRALKFSHQEIGIEQEDDKSHLDHRSPDIFLHGKYRLVSRAARLGVPLLVPLVGILANSNEQQEWKVSQTGVGVEKLFSRNFANEIRSQVIECSFAVGAEIRRNYCFGSFFNNHRRLH